MQKCPDIARAEVEQLRADGIEPTLDDLAQLMHWGALVECPAGRVGPQSDDCPVEIAERVLWPLTMQADAWLDTVRTWLPGDLILSAYGLAAERGREPDAFSQLYTRAAALSAVERWRATFAGSESELTRALARLVPDIRPSDAEPDDAEPPILPPQFDLAPLVAATGLPLEYWQRHTSRHCLAVMTAMAERAALEAGHKPVRDPSREAHRELLCVVAQIRRRAAPSAPTS